MAVISERNFFKEVVMYLMACPFNKSMKTNKGRQRKKIRALQNEASCVFLWSFNIVNVSLYLCWGLYVSLAGIPLQKVQYQPIINQ